MGDPIQFILVTDSGVDIEALLRTSVEEALAGTTGEAEVESTLAQLTIGYRLASGSKDIVGIALPLDILAEDSDALAAVRDLMRALAAQDTVHHVLKLDDPYLRAQHHELARELAVTEMKLREALTVIFLEQYGEDEEYYSLLRESEVKFATSDPVDATQMSALAENEFFHIGFAAYRGVHRRKLPTKIPELTALIQEVGSFDDLQTALRFSVISNEEHTDFILSLTELLDPIERVRNCVAHNRTIPPRVYENYQQARPQLIRRLDEFLSTLHVSKEPQDQAPAPQDQAPAPQDQAPAPQDQAPAPQDQAPAPQDQAPAPQDEENGPNA